MRDFRDLSSADAHELHAGVTLTLSRARYIVRTQRGNGIA
jgi:hypothetical protein